MRFLVINGPNLNLLGSREPDIYGKSGYDALVARIRESAASMNVEVECMQSNHEGAIIDAIHKAKGAFHGIIINPGAYTHTSIAIRDAFLSVQIPFIEVHLSNIFKREEFRHHSYLSDIAEGCIIGLGVHGYFSAAAYFLTAE